MKKLTNEQTDELIKTLKLRFEKSVDRHPNIIWKQVFEKLVNNHEKIWSLSEMERTGGEPDIVAYDENTNDYIFYDCSIESPSGRRNICYDREALESRKKFKPENNAIDMAKEMGIEILSEEEYKHLQSLGQFDLKTSSWIETPIEIRKLGGATFGDRRYDTVFIYHNGADSYYAARGFRGSLRV
jgi:hypothetical protein